MIKKLLLMTCLMLTSSLAGCVSETPMNDAIEVPIEKCPVLPPGHADDGVLRILTYDIYALSDEVVADFTNQTGIEVEFIRTDDAGGILDQLMQTKEAQQADLMIGLDNTYLQTALENCLLNVNSADVEGISDEALAPYSGKYAVPFDQGYVCLNYDENFVDGENVTAPTSLWNLTEETWKGKTAFPSPLSSSPGRAFMTATIDYFENDEDNTTDAFDWWQAMAENDAIFTSGWTEAYETHYTGGYGEWTEGYIGDAHLTVSYCHSPGVEAYFGGNWTHSTSLVLPRASFHQVEYAGVINGAANISNANAFIEFLLSEEINSGMPVNNYMYPVLAGHGLPEDDGYKFHSDIVSEPAQISVERIDIDMQHWLEAWIEATA